MKGGETETPHRQDLCALPGHLPFSLSRSICLSPFLHLSISLFISLSPSLSLFFFLKRDGKNGNAGIFVTYIQYKEKLFRLPATEHGQLRKLQNGKMINRAEAVDVTERLIEATHFAPAVTRPHPPEIPHPITGEKHWGWFSTLGQNLGMCFILRIPNAANTEGSNM